MEEELVNIVGIVLRIDTETLFYWNKKNSRFIINFFESVHLKVA